MDRRSFLVGAGGLALAQLTSGCSSWNQAAFKVRLLKDSIPAQLVGEFRQGLKQPAALKYDPEQQLKKLFSYLQTWKLQAGKKDTQPQWRLPLIGGGTPAVADLVTLGDYWLETAIRQELIQPLEIQQLNGWKQLPQRWQELVLRDRVGQLSDSGLVWGAPYRWGSTVIAYNRDKFKELGLQPPKDWDDLWREELRDRISLLDQPREVIGLTLKKLGHSYNTTNLSQVPKLKEELRKLHQQVKFYSSDNYLQPLILGDTWLAVGWSTDILPLGTSYRQIQAVVPSSGTALWADLWVQPASLAAESKPVKTGNQLTLTQQWIDFCWKPKPAREISLFTNAASPIITRGNRADLPEDLRKNPLLLPDSAVLDKSEFLKPLPKEAVKEYEDLWKEIRLLKNQPSAR
jgi:putative spermidine/putrescine transport system substrate-binding protein